MNRKLIMPILVVVVVAEIAYLGLLFSRPHANTQILASPKASHITIDGSKNKSAGGVYLAPGTHTVKASFPGFTDKTQTFTVAKNKPAKAVFLLTPNSGTGNEYIAKHPGEQDEREQLGGQQYSTDTGTVQKLYPIITLLPHEGSDFVVNYGKSKKNPSDPYAFALYVSVPAPGQEALALNWIKYSGYNPNDFEVIYQYQGERD